MSLEEEVPFVGLVDGFMIFLGIIIILLIITRNVALSMGVGLLFVPLIIWLITQSGLATVLTIILGVLVGIKFLPTARAAWAKYKNMKGFVRGR